MLQKILLTGITCCINLLICAQSNTVSTGKDASGSGGSVSYTVGQIDYTNQQASTGKVSQGVQQPYEIYQTSGLNDLENVSVSIGPNPTFGTVIIQCKNNVLVDGDALLYDSNGKLVSSTKIKDVTTEIDMTLFAGGIYSLQILEAKKPISSFKIVKN